MEKRSIHLSTCVLVAINTMDYVRRAPSDDGVLFYLVSVGYTRRGNAMKTVVQPCSPIYSTGMHNHVC